MPFPLSMTVTMSRYLLTRKLRGQEKFPLVLMREPLHACNLTCTGCGRIREYQETIRETISVEQCLQAVDDCGAPIVSICGGEPMIYQPLDELGSALLRDFSSTYTLTASKKRTICAWSAKGSSAPPSKGFGLPKPPGSWSAPTRPSIWRPRWGKSRPCSIICKRSAVTGTCSLPATPIAPS